MYATTQVHAGADAAQLGGICTQRVFRSRWHGGKFYAMHWGYKMDNQQGGGNAGCARPAGAADYAWTAFAGSE